MTAVKISSPKFLGRAYSDNVPLPENIRSHITDDGGQNKYDNARWWSFVFWSVQYFLNIVSNPNDSFARLKYSSICSKTHKRWSSFDDLHDTYADVASHNKVNET